MARYLASRLWHSASASWGGLGVEAAAGPGVLAGRLAGALLGWPRSGGERPAWRCFSCQPPQDAAQLGSSKRQHDGEPLVQGDSAAAPHRATSAPDNTEAPPANSIPTRTSNNASSDTTSASTHGASGAPSNHTASPAINSSSSSSSAAAATASSTHRGAGPGVARIGSGGSGDILQRFREEGFVITPPVSFIRGMPAPTAMSWLRRRGPQVPHAVLYRLFRQRQVRLYDGEKVVRVRGCRQLANGERLLFPASLRSAAEARADGSSGGGHLAAPGAGAEVVEGGAGRVGSHADAGPGPGSSSGAGSAGSAGAAGAAATAAAAAAGAGAAAAGAQRSALFGPRVCATVAAASASASTAAGGTSSSSNMSKSSSSSSSGLLKPQLLTPERVRRWVLGVHPGLVFINKPAGVRVHGRAAGDADSGGRGGRDGDGPTLDSVMGQALRFGEQDEPKLVHRLDAQASGVMVVARNADAAAWLSAAFRGKAQQALKEAEEEEAGRGEGARGGRAGRGRQTGASPDGDIPADLYVARTYWAFLAGDLQPRQTGRIRFPVAVDGAFYPAVSSYRVRGTGCGVTWVELQPETGRRHQLRIHCARKLGAPIIGDGRYGYAGLPPRLALRDRLPPEWWALLGEDPRLVVQRLQQQRQQQQQAEEEEEELGGVRSKSGGRAAEAAEAALGMSRIPIMLHARELLIKRPGKSPLVGVAPLPRYMRELMEAAGWPLPRDD
ncbi:hypothetical protein HYH02_010390 [Chlamydomonas schloesseri]|uniref:Pseudouridine synthase RsuA/RluA-like domain-containing protein n=1 Tax=Chlamydomonas schloesseri TaxID=2026947 RepID=A0A835T7U0_9CHLO|nr:hypothetical protein HYH02_010390 [Chlamydomonas schloesseri]|eukprot:KAG2440512.1 hypothetical protein HYH02_010390 [Chlamydomonas schloesseri]